MPEKFSSTQNICVLGCAGFIGSHLLTRLLENDQYTVVGIDRESNKIAHIKNHPRFTFFNDDVQNESLTEWCIQRSDVVVSLSAICNPSVYTQKPVEVIESNFSHPFKIARICSRQKKWLIQFSTSEVYGKTIASLVEPATACNNAEYILSDDHSPFILGPTSAQRWSYACAKQLLERAIYGLGYEQNLAFTIVRPFNFIGSRMDYIPGIDGEGVPRVLACFMEAFLKQQPLKLVDGGVNRRAFTYIDDAVDAVMTMINRPEAAKGQIFNIGNPANEVSIAQLAALMIECYKEIQPQSAARSFTTQNVSAASFYGEGYEDSDRRMPDISKAQKLLGWSPKTSLRDALRPTMAAYLKQYGNVG